MTFGEGGSTDPSHLVIGRVVSDRLTAKKQFRRIESTQEIDFKHRLLRYENDKQYRSKYPSLRLRIRSFVCSRCGFGGMSQEKCPADN